VVLVGEDDALYSQRHHQQRENGPGRDEDTNLQGPREVDPEAVWG
jgi:hypothetical protein